MTTDEEVHIPPRFYSAPQLTKGVPELLTRKQYHQLYLQTYGSIVAKGHIWFLRSKSVPNAGLLRVWVELPPAKKEPA